MKPSVIIDFENALKNNANPEIIYSHLYDVEKFLEKDSNFIYSPMVDKIIQKYKPQLPDKICWYGGGIYQYYHNDTLKILRYIRKYSVKQYVKMLAKCNDYFDSYISGNITIQDIFEKVFKCHYNVVFANTLQAIYLAFHKIAKKHGGYAKSFMGMKQ